MLYMFAFFAVNRRFTHDLYRLVFSLQIQRLSCFFRNQPKYVIILMYFLYFIEKVSVDRSRANICLQSVFIFYSVLASLADDTGVQRV